MSDVVHVVAVSGDPGGAEALAPVLAALLESGALLHAFAYAQAGAVWTQRGIPHQSLPADFAPLQCADLLSRHRADFLLTSTSMNGVDLERKFVSAARAAGIPSLAVLDWWSNYRGRFADVRGEMNDLPDRIAVMDERARREMVAQGFDEERLVITGQPAFAEVAAWKSTAPATTRQAVRRAFAVGESDCFVVFGSQPLSRLPGADAAAKDGLGYSERTVIPLLVDALEQIAVKSGRAVTLLVRPHPRESEADYAALGSRKIAIIVSREGHRREVALAADLVAGMNSAFLLESCLLGCPTISLQPGLRQPDSLPTNAAGLSRAVYDADEILPAVSQMLLDPASCVAIRNTRRHSSDATDASANILTLIRQMIRPPCHVH